jgi:hypothetical protein
MKSILIAALAVSVLGIGASGAWAAKANKLAKPDKRETRTQKPAPLVAQVIKVEGDELSVRTRPITGPDGLITSKDKTYTTTAKTTVQVNGENKAVSDLLAGEVVRLDLSDDGKTVEKVAARLVTPADRTARKAQRQTKNAAVAPAPEAGKVIP